MANGDGKLRGTASSVPRSLPSPSAIQAWSNSRCRSLPLRRDEVFEYRRTHEIRRQQALAQDEVVKLLLIELAAQRRLGFLAQGEQARIAIEVAVGLSGAAESEALYFFRGKGMAQHHILLEHRVGLRLRHRTALQLGVEESAGGAQ